MKSWSCFWHCILFQDNIKDINKIKILFDKVIKKEKMVLNLMEGNVNRKDVEKFLGALDELEKEMKKTRSFMSDLATKYVDARSKLMKIPSVFLIGFVVGVLVCSVLMIVGGK